VPDFQAYFTSIPRSRVPLAARGRSRGVAELVELCGHEVFVSKARKVPYISQSNDKDDPEHVLRPLGAAVDQRRERR
jgi:hypothetical protein